MRKIQIHVQHNALEHKKRTNVRHEESIDCSTLKTNLSPSQEEPPKMGGLELHFMHGIYVSSFLVHV